MSEQATRAETFKTLHQSGCFVIPNPWSIGSAKLLEGLGFKALATTSAGFAREVGFDDYELTREHVLTHVEALCAATDLPLSADLENGFGHRPEDCFETITLGAKAGLVGGSIEDFTGTDGEQYSIEAAKDRVAAAVEAARALAFPFTLTARAENFFTRTPDLGDTIKRLQAYQEVGADVLYAPGLRTLDDIKSVLSSVDLPVNVLLGPGEKRVPVTELAALGVRRVSVGSVLANVAMDAVLKAGRELAESGTFSFMSDLSPTQDIVDVMFKR